MARSRGPSAFSDSPEDLIERAEEMAKQEDVPRETAQLLWNLSRALEKERVDRVTYTQMTTETAGRAAAVEKECERRGRLLAHPFRLAAQALASRVRRAVPSAYLADLAGMVEDALEVRDG